MQGKILHVAILAGGQRIAQLIRAKVCDFDLDTHTLRLLDTKGKRSQAREHLVPVGPRAATIIRELISQRKDSDSLIFSLHVQSVGLRVTKITKAMGGTPFDLRDIRRTVETQLASMGISKDTRAQLLSHGISGVQAAHYDRYEYINEKRNALLAWEQRLEDITNGTQSSNVVTLGHAA